MRDTTETKGTCDNMIIRRAGIAGFLTLNRPKAIHALTHDMCLAMSAALERWRTDPTIKIILIDHSEGRGFCAGGDISMLRESALSDGGAAGRRFFYDEYRLNHQLFTYPKPIVTFMDGIVMGGGCGIAEPSLYRVASENSRYAMPETAIGLFPDVGGGWYLSRLSGRLGAFLALTGARLDGAECLWAGIATHYLPAATLITAKARMAEGTDIANTLSALATTPPEARIAANAAQINRHFAGECLEDIFASLMRDSSDWAAKELATLQKKSPLSCKVALRQIATAAKLDDFAENMRMEYRIASRIILQPDFAEGVRAVIIDKTHAPLWNPPTPQGVSAAMLDAIFAPLPVEEEWTVLES